MGLFKLGFVAVYLSDPIISGFTTGAAILVFTSQVKHILGLTVPRYAGAFAVVKVGLTVSSKDAIKSTFLRLIGSLLCSEWFLNVC